MQNATLMSHVDTDLVTREQLALVETPDATRSFKPVPHIELIATLEACPQAEPHRHSERAVCTAPGWFDALRRPAACVSRYGGRHGSLGPAHVEQPHDVDPDFARDCPSSSATTWSFAGT